MSAASTRNLWRAAYLLAHGLEFVRARRVGGPVVVFIFDDPNDEAPVLTKQFDEDPALQRLIDSRHVISRALDAAQARGVCEPHDIAEALQHLSARDETGGA